MQLRRKPCAMLLLALLLVSRLVHAADKIDFVQEKLDNGLQVIYAPLRQAPVVHVRVLYHVGSRDERPDRQGFAHMFEHMMFRGSEHVKPQEHMKLIEMVGGYSNAYTSFDQTVYVNTIPANQLDLALYLEADRMASFKVSEEIYGIERNVVMEEWRRKQNSLYGNFYEDFFKLVYSKHPYQWTPIGNMEHLKAAHASELQEFFNKYYVPNNAVLVIAGDIDVDAAKALVRKYYAWIPKAADVVRDIPEEPAQTAVRRAIEARAVPLTRLMIGWRVPPFRSDDHYALSLLASVLGAGNTSRLDRLLVNSANPPCMNVGASDMALEDGGYFAVTAVIMRGKDPEQVEKMLTAAINDVIEKGVTEDELNKAKIRERVDFVHNRETAEKVAQQLGHEALIGGNAARANEALDKLNALTAADVQAVAKKYLRPDGATTLRMDPGKEPPPAQPTTMPVAAARPVSPRAVVFPQGYPAHAPVADSNLRATFEKGAETQINGVKVIVMPDARLPFVSWGLTMRAGSHADPAGKEGLADLTAELVRRGAAGETYEQINQDLETRGISIGVSDGGDFTRLSGSCLTEQLDHAFQRSRDILRSPTFPEDEFKKVKEQTLNSLQMGQARPDTVASHELAKATYGDTPLGRFATPASVGAITLDDVKACYQRLYRPADAALIISGDLTPERGQALARKLLDGWETAKLPSPDYELKPAAQDKLRLIVVDRPEGQQAMIRMAARGYSIQNDEKFAGSLAGGILSAGIDARLGRYVRAQKGLVYSVWGVFQPGRHGGQFSAGAETKLATAADTIEAMLKVFADMGKDGVTEQEMTEARLRAVGGMVMGMQTMQQQAGYRVEGLLNGYPIDYYDRYPERISAVTPSQVGQVAAKYIQPQRLTVVIVAPAAAVKEQLSRLGSVEIVPMPDKR